MVAAYEFMYVTPGIQNLIREKKVFRIDSEIQTGKRYAMQLLDETLWNLAQAGKISAEEAIDKSRVPGQMVEKFRNIGLDINRGGDDFGGDEGDGGGAGGAGVKTNGPKPVPPAGGASEADRRAAIEANRARLTGKK
jgi:hypothetical protein